MYLAQLCLSCSVCLFVSIQFCLLHGTCLVYQERAWYLEHKYLTPSTSRQIRNQVSMLHEIQCLVRPQVFSAHLFPMCMRHPGLGHCSLNRS